MRPAILLFALCLLAGAASAQNDTNGTGTMAGGGATFTLIAQLNEGAYVWVDLEGNTNPTLRVEPNSPATIFIQQGETTGDVPHSIQVGGGEVSDQVVAPGASAAVTFRSPPSGTLPYTCTIHPSTMKGTIQVAEDAQESRGENGTPGGSVLAILGVVALAALVARRHRQ